MGDNLIPEEDWNIVKELGAVKAMLKAGDLIVDKTEELVHDSDSGFILSSMSAKKAIGLVENTIDRAKLIEWQEEETRSTVLKALDKKIDELTFHPEKDSKPDHEILEADAEIMDDE